MLTNGTTENASLNSKQSMSEIDNPALCRTFFVEYCGAIAKSTGYISASA